ncbi:hypothetical protein GE09DRAFT_1138704, partial [Coniochaeta sp. 2T2.1]
SSLIFFLVLTTTSTTPHTITTSGSLTTSHAITHHRHPLIQQNHTYTSTMSRRTQLETTTARQDAQSTYAMGKLMEFQVQIQMQTEQLVS